jgi:thymidine phosphorylase
MNQVLASSAGNALEVVEATKFLTGVDRNPRLLKVTLVLCSEMLIASGIAVNQEDALNNLMHALDSGKAAEIFSRMVFLQGGPSDFVENYSAYLPRPRFSKAIYPDNSGIVVNMDTRRLGMAVVAMGGGRCHPHDIINHSVGLSEIISLGELADSNRPLAIISADSEEDWHIASKAIKESITLSDNSNYVSTPLIYDCIRKT